MIKLELNRDALPGIYQSADKASLNAQFSYFFGLKSYLILLVLAAFVSYFWPKDPYGAIVSASLFLITLAILIALRFYRPDDLWYNGRAVAESVKTRAWRWCMRAEPYQDCENVELVSRQFINDQKAILKQNRSLSNALEADAGVKDPISETMLKLRALSTEERLDVVWSKNSKPVISIGIKSQHLYFPFKMSFLY